MGNTNENFGAPCAVCGHKPAFAIWWVEVEEYRCHLHSPYYQKEIVANTENDVYNVGGEAWMANCLCEGQGEDGDGK